jgi:fimbrial isopeptide formation D2 family protein/LPXTG-motif cell wall-anchored protein
VKRKGKISKLLSVVVSAAMALSCFSGVAFAADEETSNTTARDFEVFQIFTGDFNDTTLTLGNVKWGVNGIQETGTSVDSTITKELTDLSGSSIDDNTKLNAILKYAKLDKTANDETEVTPYSSTEEFKSSVTYTPGTNGSHTFTGVPDGYYLIRDKAGSQSNGFYTVYVAQVTSGTLYIQTKGNVPTVEKQVSTSADTGWEDETTAAYDQTLYFKLTGNVSSRIDNFKEYYYEFTDKMSKGLEYVDDSIHVYYNSISSDNEITKYFYKNVSNYSATDGTTIKVAIQDLKQLENIKVSDATDAASKYPLKDKDIIVTYQAKLNGDAVIKDPNTNEVQLSFYNDPNHSGTGNSDTPSETPGEPTPKSDIPKGESEKDTVNVYTTALQITKINTEKNRLTGAKFKIEGNGQSKVITISDKYTLMTEEEKNAYTGDVYYLLKDGTYTKTAPKDDTKDLYTYVQRYYKLEKNVETVGNGDVTTTNMEATVGDDGVLTFWGLGAGTYTLTETNPPSGYNAIAPQTIKIEYGNATGTTTSGKQFYVSNYNAIGSAATYDGMLYYDCENQLGSTLPTTGGIGTTIFYVVGTILVLGAGIALVTRRRMRKETRQI